MGTIKYYLQPNPVTPDPNDQSARVQPKAILDNKMVAQKMVQRSSSYTLPVIEGVLSLYYEVASDEIADGNYINTPLVNMKPGINGVFASASDSFDPSRHVIKGTFMGGTLLNQKLRLSQTEKMRQPLREPFILEYSDANSKTFNSIATPSGVATITGEELKFNPENAEEGVFFIAENGTETRVEAFAVRTEGQLIFNVPAGLTAGEYTLQVRRAYGVNNKLRTGELRDTLTVA